MMSMLPGGPLDTSQSGQNLAETRKNMDGTFAKPTAMAPEHVLRMMDANGGKLPPLNEILGMMGGGAGPPGMAG